MTATTASTSPAPAASAPHAADGVVPPDATAAEQDYLFDLQGYRILPKALSPDEVRQINAWVDAQDISALKPGDWIGDVQIQTYGSKDGTNFQNIIEGGPIFEKIIDHPSWIEQIRRYIVLAEHGLLGMRIDECFLNVREEGGFIPLHSGGANRRFTGLFRWPSTGEWAVGQINIIMALTDIGPGDGATVIIPGSHKSAMHHPRLNWQAGVTGHATIPAKEVHLRAGDAVMFTDALMHGSTPRINPGQRRILVYRYAPVLLAPRFNYIPSEELIGRLTPQQRSLVMGIAPRMRPGRVLRAETFAQNVVHG